jgi:succinate dehydrogenase/fumarate reductase flavoprotein subunit
MPMSQTAPPAARHLSGRPSADVVVVGFGIAGGCAAHCDWLESLGFEFERSYYPEKAVIQPGTQGLMYTGNEKVWPFRDIAVPAPRGHKVPAPGDTGGARLVVDLLLRRAAALGVEIRYETAATELITTAVPANPGRVTGVRWRTATGTGVIPAGSVILAAGGFVMNAEMVARHVPQLAEKPFVLGTSYDDGAGIKLGLSAGAEALHLDRAFITAPFYPPAKLVTGIVVNRGRIVLPATGRTSEVSNEPVPARRAPRTHRPTAAAATRGS